uniref:Uncharacterized protein n=1 Tax=Glossina pallidipes TaxID=7398 RepID=A0A1A9ZMH2_GLOPL
MITFDELVTQPDEIDVDLQKDLVNYKKTPKDRKTLQYLRKRNRKSKSYWKSSINGTTKYVGIHKKHTYNSQGNYTASNFKRNRQSTSGAALTRIKRKQRIEMDAALNMLAAIQADESVHILCFNTFCSQDSEIKCKNYQPTCGSNNPAITQQRVPKIPLFGGDRLKWKKVSELSHKCLHKHPISSATKTLYLKANFMEEVEHLRRHLSPTKDNYNNARKIFHDKYDNKFAPSPLVSS